MAALATACAYEERTPVGVDTWRAARGNTVRSRTLRSSSPARPVKGGPITVLPSRSEAVVPRRIEDRDALVMEFLPLARTVALSVYQRLPLNICLDDLINAGILGLIDAASRYDPEKEVTFTTYAKFRIRGAILDSLRDQDWASRGLRTWHKRFATFAAEFSQNTGRGPSDVETADALGVGLERWREIAIELRVVSQVAAATGSAVKEDETPLREIPATDRMNPDVLAIQQQLKTTLSVALNQLPPRHQMVIRLYYLAEQTMFEIGKALGVNESRVSQIHKAALRQLACQLSSAGIETVRSIA